MRQAIGWVIVGKEGLFVGYRHPGTRKTGFPVWAEKGFSEFKRPAIYGSAKEAVDVAHSIYMRDQIQCAAKPLYIGDED